MKYEGRTTGQVAVACLNLSSLGLFCWWAALARGPVPLLALGTLLTILSYLRGLWFTAPITIIVLAFHEPVLLVSAVSFLTAELLRRTSLTWRPQARDRRAEERRSGEPIMARLLTNIDKMTKFEAATLLTAILLSAPLLALGCLWLRTTRPPDRGVFPGRSCWRTGWRISSRRITTR